MEAPVCALVDAMFRLPAKLDVLLVRHGHTLPRGAADEIPLIKQDLENMVAILHEHDQLGAQDPAMMVKCLTKEVRELSYDMEDSVDQYEHAAGTRRWILSPCRRKYKITIRRGKTAWRLPEKLKWRLWMANKLREFSVRWQEALQRYSLFKNSAGGTGISSSSASTCTRFDPPFGSWHPTPYGEPVGIDAPLKKLEAWLGKDGEQKLKVVSVVGSGGVGKTTLANELYRRTGGQFECRAFVRTSRKPDVRRLLISMLSQIRPHQTPHTWEVHSLIADVRTHLQDKRYLILIDDIWDTQTWAIINRALPDGNLCSGVLITTEVEDVALNCCGYDSNYVFSMKPLGYDDSSKLFFNTAFGPKYECPSELSEVASSIIRKCAGLPLAMVIVANILVGQMGKPEQWDYVNKSLGYGLRTNLNSEGMKQVLNLIYNSLPEHLKPCVMYLSIYEEDYIIQKDDMVKQWIAEGFIHATEKEDKEEIASSYFDALVSSRMIQPIYVNDNDDVLSCSVHYMVLDFVTHKSIVENFVTAIDHCQTTARLADKVRRLSLHFGNAEATPPTNMRLSQVRTLAYFGSFKCLPSIVEFGLLQVLILHLWSDDESISFDLSRISKLFRLRYLHVTCNATLEVPQTQMRGLQYLETLKIDARVSAVPSDIVHLPGLLHLSLPAETNLPNGIGHLTSLWTLGYFDLSVNSIRNVQSLGELTNLRDLRLTFSTVRFCCPKGKMDNMGSVLAKLSNLRSLTLEPSSILDVELSSMNISCDRLSIISSPPAFLRRFEWLPCICTFSSLPKWIGHLEKLCILKIGIYKLVSNDVDVLRGLPALTVLSLYVRTKPAKRIVFNKTGFSVLKHFKFRCSVPWLEFEVDTMPNLRRFKLDFDAHGSDQHTIPLGIEHLLGLKEISAKIGGGGADDPDRKAAESALSYATKMHPAHPTFNIQHVDRMFPGKNEYNSGLQEEEHMTLQKQYEFTKEDSIEQHQVLQKDSREDAHSRTCAGCKNPIGHGRFLSCMDAVWHPQCFRCFACNKPISEYEFAVHEDQPYHKSCYKDFFHPKCDVCKNFIPTNRNGLIEYRAHPFWMQKYCPSHEYDGTPRCCSCERMEPTDSKYITLDDGRKLCLECLTSATMDSPECQHLYMDIQEFFEGLNMKVEQQVPLLLVERQALNEALEAEKSGHHLPETRGLCFSEEQIVRTILRRPTIGPGNIIMDMITGPYKLVRRCEVTAILILYGLPRLQTGSILAHEMMHAYLRLKGYRTLSPQVEEGICQVLSHMWLESEIIAGATSNVASTSAASSSSSSSTPTSSKKGAKTEFEKKLGAFIKNQIETDSSVEYGDGFRAGNRAVEQYGLRRTLDHMKTTGSFP